jgi:hypothetical protein
MTTIIIEAFLIVTIGGLGNMWAPWWGHDGIRSGVLPGRSLPCFPHWR